MVSTDDGGSLPGREVENRGTSLPEQKIKLATAVLSLLTQAVLLAYAVMHALGYI